VRVQQREDGAIVDQIVISPDAYLTSAPGTTRSDTVVLDQTTSATNQPPSAVLTAPAQNSSFEAPVDVPLVASASDPENRLTKVEFYAGSSLIGTATAAPYTVVWRVLRAGTYTLTAVAFDADGGTGFSTPIQASVTATGVPDQFSDQDIGTPQIGGDATEAGGAWTVTAGGADIWGTADQFHFVYQQLTGDMEIVARVDSLRDVNSWSKAGVMIRESLLAGSRHAFALVSAEKGYAFQRRLETNGISANTNGGLGAAPGWVRLVRSGDRFDGYRSDDGQTWTLIGSDNVSMPPEVYIGLAVTSHNPTSATVATIDQVTLTQTAAPPPPNQPPSVSLTAPSNGAAYTAPAAIDIAAAATDADGSVASVEFYAGSTSLFTSTTAPYTFTWQNAPAGTYLLTAVARDDRGAQTTSAALQVTVNPPNQPPTVSLISPSSGAVFTAPATIGFVATASDVENRLARVEFYAGSTLVGTSTAPPYTFNWTAVPAGSYTLTAIAFDADGGKTASAAVTVAVNPPPPQTWTVMFTASVDHANVTSYRLDVFASGADPQTAPPIASIGLGKPTPNSSGDIAIDESPFIRALSAGSYLATVSAIGSGGESRSASYAFTR
jgi:hypothetical protein